MGNGNFELISRDKVPEGEKVLPMVWQMKRKRDIRTRAIKKCKARLNVDGSRMEQGKHYDKSYAPVVRWSSIRLLLILAACLNWHTSQIDYVQQNGCRNRRLHMIRSWVPLLVAQRFSRPMKRSHKNKELGSCTIRLLLFVSPFHGQCFFFTYHF